LVVSPTEHGRAVAPHLSGVLRRKRALLGMLQLFQLVLLLRKFGKAGAVHALKMSVHLAAVSGVPRGPRVPHLTLVLQSLHLASELMHAVHELPLLHTQVGEELALFARSRNTPCHYGAPLLAMSFLVLAHNVANYVIRCSRTLNTAEKEKTGDVSLPAQNMGPCTGFLQAYMTGGQDSLRHVVGLQPNAAGVFLRYS